MFFIKKQNVALPSWAQVFGQDKCPACVDTAAHACGNNMDRKDGKPQGWSMGDLFYLSISVRPHKWGVSTAPPRAAQQLRDAQEPQHRWEAASGALLRPGTEGLCGKFVLSFLRMYRIVGYLLQTLQKGEGEWGAIENGQEISL